MSSIINGSDGYTNGTKKGTISEQKQFHSEGDLTQNHNGSGFDGGWAVLSSDKILTVNGTFTEQGNLILLGHGTSTSAQGDVIAKDDQGLAVLKAEDVKVQGPNFDAVGYALISTKSVEVISNKGIHTYAPTPDGGSQLTFAEGKQPQHTLMVFQNQTADGSYSIEKEKLPAIQIDDGIYVDTKDLMFKVSGSAVSSHKDLQVHLNGTAFVQTGGTVSAKGSFILSRADDDSITADYELSGSGKISTSDVRILDGATLKVSGDDTAAPVVGTGKAQAGSLVLGGKDFKLNAVTPEGHKANGRIESALPINFVGGDFRFGDGDSTTGDSLKQTGIQSSGSITGVADSFALEAGTLIGETVDLEVKGDFSLTDWAYVNASGTEHVTKVKAENVYVSDKAILGRISRDEEHTGDVTVVADNLVSVMSGAHIAGQKVTVQAGSLLIDGKKDGEYANSQVRANQSVVVGAKDAVLKDLTVSNEAMLVGGNKLEVYANKIDLLSKGLATATQTLDIVSAESSDLAVFVDAGSSIGNTALVNLTGHQGVAIAGGGEIKSILQRANGKEAQINVLANAGLISIDGTKLNTLIPGKSTGEIRVQGSDTKDVGVKLSNATLQANDIYVGNGVGQGYVKIDGSKLSTYGDGFSKDDDKSYEFVISAGSSGLEITGSTIEYNDGDHGTTTLSSVGGVRIIDSNINDNIVYNGKKETGKGTLTVESDESVILSNSTLDDDTIVLEGADGVELSAASVIHPDSDGAGLTVKGQSVTMTGKSHIGVSKDGTSTGELEKTGKVAIETEVLTLDDASYVTTTDEDGVSITAPTDKGVSVTMDETSWIKGKKVSVTGTGVGITGGSVTTTGDKDSEITVSGGDKGISITGPSIDAGKGTVNIGTGPNDTGNITISGKEPHTGTGITGNKINIGTGIGSGTGVVIIEDTDISAITDSEDPDDEDDGKITIHTGTGTGGLITGTGITGPQVEIGVGPGGTLGITGTDITGDDIDFVAPTDPDGKNPGKIVIDGGSSVVAGESHDPDDEDEESGGKITVGTGVEVIVGEEGSITAHKGTGTDPDDPDVGTGGIIDVTGGKLTIEGGGFVEAEDDVNVSGGGSIDFTGPKDPSVDPGKLVVGGSLNLNTQDPGTGEDTDGSINVEEDGEGTIIVKDPDEGKITIGTGGGIFVGTGGTLNVGTDDDWEPDSEGPGLIIGEIGIEIDGGTLDVDRIIDENKDDEFKVTVTDNGSHIVIDDPFVDEGYEGGLSFTIDSGSGNDLTIEVGEVSKEQLDKIKEEIKDSGGQLIVGPILGVSGDKTLEDWDDLLGDKYVPAEGGVDVSDKGVDKEGNETGRDADEIGHGGGHYLVGSGKGEITVTGPKDPATGIDDGKVTITGAQTEEDRDENGDGFDVIRPKDPTQEPEEGFGGIKLEDRTELTLGSGKSWGGDIAGDVTASSGGETEGDDTTKDPNVNVEGGHWTIGGKLDLGSGDLLLWDKNFTNGSQDSTLDVEKDVNVGNLTMKGDKTKLDVGGNLTVNEDAYLTGGSKTDDSGAKVTVGGGFDVKGELTMTGNVDVNVSGATTVGGGMTVEKGTSFTGEGDLTVSGGDSNFHGSVDVGGDYTNTAGKTIVTGETDVKGKTETNDLVIGVENFTGTGANGTFTTGDEVKVGGAFTAHTGSDVSVGGNLTVTGTSTIGGNVEANGDSIFTDGLHVTEDGSFTNVSTDKGTTVGGSLILEEGSKVAAGKDFAFSGNVTIGEGGNGILEGRIDASVKIDFTGAQQEVTFTGEEAGTGSHHLLAGEKGVRYEEGASHVFNRVDKHEDGGEVTGVVTVAKGGSVTMDPSKKGSADEAFLHLNDTLTLKTDASKVVLESVTEEDLKKGAGIYVGSNGHLSLNVGENFALDDSLVKVEKPEANPGKIFVSKDSKITMDDWTLGEGSLMVDFDGLSDLTVTGEAFDKFVSDLIESNNVLMDFSYSDKDSALSMDRVNAGEFGTNDKVDEVVDAVVANKDEDKRKQELVNEVFSKDSGFMVEDGEGNWHVTDRGNQRLEEVLGLPIAAGAFNVAYDAMSGMGDSVTNRILNPEATKSTAVWADVIASRTKSKELFGNSGYSADIYAGVLGVDTWVNPTTMVGAALTVGTADAEGVGSTMGIDNDADYHGAFAYAAKNLTEKAVLSADIGYMVVENDITTSVDFGGKTDTEVFTIGLRADLTAYEGDAFKVVPHFGLRYANFGFDEMNKTATDDVNVVEVPVGVRVEGAFAAAGWNLVPTVDFTVLPQFGDKKATIRNSGAAFEQDVLEGSVVNTRFGVTGTKDNLSFGLNYRLGVGGDERQNHSFVGNVRYVF